MTRKQAKALTTGSRPRGDAVRILRAGRRSGGGAGRKESEIQREILAYLALVPEVVAWRNNTGAMFGEHKGKKWAVRFGKKGLPDIIGWQTCFGLACFLAIEVKRPGQKASPEQAAFLSQVRAAGGIALVAHSLDDVRGTFLNDRRLAAPEEREG